ncbi:MAG: hypothetical protein AB7P37_07965 [Ramlibacter sp.]
MSPSAAATSAWGWGRLGDVDGCLGAYGLQALQISVTGDRRPVRDFAGVAMPDFHGAYLDAGLATACGKLTPRRAS